MPHRLRCILITRFFLNLRHVFFKKRTNNFETLSAFNFRIPTIASEDIVGNLGAPLRDSFTSGHASVSSSVERSSWSLEASTRATSGSSLRPRQKRPNKGKARADPLLDWDVDDLDEEELEDMEIVSRRPMLVGLEIDPNAMGEGSGGAVWREGFDGINVEGEEAISLMNRGENNSVANTPIRSVHSHSKGEGGRNSLPPSRHPSKSTVDEGDALLVDADAYSRSSMASTVHSESWEVSPRRTSYL